jgi:hypothetical protein
MKKIIVYSMLLIGSGVQYCLAECCGGQSIDATEKFCCADSPHSKNISTRSLSLNLAKYTELCSKVASALPGAAVSWTPPGSATFSYSDKQEDKCCSGDVKTIHTVSQSVNVGMGSVTGNLPLVGIAGFTSAGVRVTGGGSVSYSINDGSDCNKTQICGSAGISANLSLCVYASALAGYVDISGCATGAPSTTAQLCCDTNTGTYSYPSASLTMTMSIGYTIFAIGFTDTGSVSLGSVTVSSG